MSGASDGTHDPSTDPPLWPRDQRTFELVFARHHRAVRQTAVLICGPAAAPDIVQEIFARLWAQPERYDPSRGSLQKYLTVQAYCRSVDRLRSDGARTRREQRYSEWASADNPSAEAAVETLGTSELIRDEVLRLPASQTRPIMLAFFGGYSYRRVAEVLSVPEGTVKSRIRAGLSTLRVRLDGAASDQTTPLRRSGPRR